MVQSRTYFVNFVEPGKNNGCCVVEVSDNEFPIDLIERIIRDQAIPLDLSNDPEDRIWISRVILKVLKENCCPDLQGAIAAIRVDNIPGYETQLSKFPRHKLMLEDEVADYGCRVDQIEIKNGKIVSATEVRKAGISAWDEN